MNKLKIILAASLAATLTLSCSNGDDNEGDSSSSNENLSSSSNGGGNSSSGGAGNSSSSDGGGNSSGSDGGGNSSGSSGNLITETYTLKNVTDDQFTLVEDYKHYECLEGGVLYIDENNYENTVSYLINNQILTLEIKDTLQFNGTSSQLTGTWTRAKNKAASCELYEDKEYDESWYDCKSGWDITKVVFTTKTVEFTRNYCPTDEEIERTNEKGWTTKVIDCETLEVFKGSDKITVRQTVTNTEESIYVNYKGNSCEFKESRPSEAQRIAACKKAWDEHKDDDDWEDYYWNSIYGGDKSNYHNCIRNLLPADFFDDDEEGAGKISAKPAAKAKAKAKFASLLKKRK